LYVLAAAFDDRVAGPPPPFRSVPRLGTANPCTMRWKITVEEAALDERVERGRRLGLVLTSSLNAEALPQFVSTVTV